MTDDLASFDSPEKVNRMSQQIEMISSKVEGNLSSSQLQVEPNARNQSVPDKTNQAHLDEDIESKNGK